ncbi:XRE family transcriptional regulator [Actinoalloteichus hymeniacidonis]|uniref:Transcriptional regulator n=1 Tax=Actinoalloteichus hymeniacidonis TaxID=340345 RepID=A0AAC9MX58_9PSEU|nr:XRE family transcriptional regulator [Actinoalloteichus hymeniacidonis]AOS61696.1 putative transcriptional regulator [Actinoalloteichus hymeniacidonis]MBB5910286.1 transcriptional regulator with XRE-family HTH domain [Actinoalloteichus hymeniacidonis]
MAGFSSEDSTKLGVDRDLITLGKRLRHLRSRRGLTLAELGERVGRAPSQLSLLENGKREPKLSLLHRLADALGVSIEELLSGEAPTRRDELEIALDEAQRDPLYASLGLGHLKIGRRVPNEVLEHLLGLYGELRSRDARRAATPEEARLANAALRTRMREQDNYFPEVEQAAARTLAAVGYTGGALSEGTVMSIVAHCGFTVRYVPDLPRTVRSVTDLRHRRIYLKRESVGMHSPRTILLHTLGHFVLGHSQPKGFADFLSQRVEANYFAAATLIPESSAVPFLAQAKADRDLAVEDLRDVFSVSYEMAAHRFTNLSTRHLDLVGHFVRNDETGIILKAYENDGLILPTDAAGAIEGQRMCRQWSGRRVFGSPDRYSIHYQYTDKPNGTHWCVSHVDPSRERNFAITLGVPYADSRWFRGRDTTNRAVSRCPTGECCRRPPADLAGRWEGFAWPSARGNSHVLAAMPPGTFPGVDETDVYSFLERYDAE